MYEEEVEKLKELATTIKRINGKVKLLSLLNKAKAKYDENKYDECEETCLEILETNPENPIALRGLGCVFQMRGCYDKALDYYSQALRFSEHKEIEYTLIGTIYYIQDKFDEAIENYNLAIDVNDSYDEAYDGRNQSMLERHVEILDLQDSLIRQQIF